MITKRIIAIVVIAIVSLSLALVSPVKAHVFCSEHGGTVYSENSLGGSHLEVVPGEIIVKFRQGLAEDVITTRFSSLDELNRRFGLKEVRKLFETEELSSIHKLTFPRDIPLSLVVKEYSANPFVEYAEPNRRNRIFGRPNDVRYSEQWAHRRMQSELAWSIEKGNSNVVIAIIDTGVDWDHPDLAENIWNNIDEVVDGIDNDGNGYVDDVRGYDFVDTTEPIWPGEDGIDPDNDPMDFHGHGTHVAGIAAAVTNNSIGVAGMSWLSKIMPVRAGYKGEDGQGYLEHDDAAMAIKYAADNGANIISMSWGGYQPSNLIKEAIDYAHDKGIILVAAAGNYDGVLKWYPAGYDNVIAVAATDYDDSRSCFSVGGSNYGSWIDVAAPGGGLFSRGILSTMVDDTYEYWMGTSMSAPFVAGLTALIKAKNPAYTNEEVRSVIKSTTDPIQLGELGLLYIGVGRINAFKALQRNSTVIANLGSHLDDAFVTAGTLNINGTVAGISSSLTKVDVHCGFGFYPNTWIILNGWDYSQNGERNFSFVWDTAEVDDGVYTIKLQASDINGQVTEDRAIIFIDNSLQHGWPVSTDGMVGSPPVLWDLDSDNKLEVIVGSTDGKLYVFNDDGTLMVGWPRLLDDYAVDVQEESALGCTSPAVADMDNDGDFEIIVKSSGHLHVLHHDGTDMSGWPRYLGYLPGRYCPGMEWAPLGKLASPAIADIDDDGFLEIVTGHLYELFAFNHDGTLLNGWPVYIGDEEWWKTMWATPAIGDLDRDGDLEIVYQTSELKADVWVLHHDGTNMSGWPKIGVHSDSDCSPVLGDLDGDGYLEIAAGGGSAHIPIYVWRYDGTVLDGWPFFLPAIWDIGKVDSLSLGDVDNDNKLEVVCGSSGGGPHSIWVLNDDGTLLSGWPQGTLLGRFESSAALGDIDGDRDIEIIVGVGGNTVPSMGMLYAWHTNGSLVFGWPRFTPKGIHSSPALGDLDGDGDVEVVVGCLDGKIYAWDLNGTYNQFTMEWPMFQHDEMHTGCYLPVPLYGDLSGDGEVDIKDLAMAAKAFGSYPDHPRWNPTADVNQDKKVNIIDFVLIVSNFGKTRT